MDFHGPSVFPQNHPHTRFISNPGNSFREQIDLNSQHLASCRNPALG
jgi:hypothetical protein